MKAAETACLAEVPSDQRYLEVLPTPFELDERAIMTRQYDWISSDDDNLFAIPTLSLLPCLEEPEYHDLIHFRIKNYFKSQRDTELSHSLNVLQFPKDLPLHLPLTYLGRGACGV